MELLVKLGLTEPMGKGVEGNRINYPIVGGTFVGEGMQGMIIPVNATASTTFYTRDRPIACELT